MNLPTRAATYPVTETEPQTVNAVTEKEETR